MCCSAFIITGCRITLYSLSLTLGKKKITKIVPSFWTNSAFLKLKECRIKFTLKICEILHAPNKKKKYIYLSLEASQVTGVFQRVLKNASVFGD